ncbi:MAG TPA: zinc ribbon domain-containing protein [Candidatus Thermoplasmatota archaeon]
MSVTVHGDGAPHAAAAETPEVDLARVYTATGALLVTLVAGLLPGSAGPFLFVLGLTASIFLLRRAFPSMWLYAVWLAAVYALAFVGALAFAFSASVGRPAVSSVPALLVGSAVAEAVALYIAFALFAEVKSIRDFRTRLSVARGDSPPEYARIGLWTVALIAFFVAVNLSAVLYVGWVRGEPLLPLHAASEALLIGLGVYLLYFAEVAFGQLPPEYRKAAREHERGEALLRGTALRAGAHILAGAGYLGGMEDCPVCGRPLAEESRACPKCGRAAAVGWCGQSEVHVVACEHCTRPVVYGKPLCPHCNGELRESLKCAHCGVHSALSEWGPAGAEPA